MNQPNDPFYLHAFALLPQFGPLKLLKLINGFTTFQAAYEANRHELLSAGIDAESVDTFFHHREKIQWDAEREKLSALDITLLSRRHPLYPTLLSEIHQPPALIYYKGNLEMEELCIAVVGTRQITNYGRVVTPYICQPLIDAGATIVSGLAYGVDSAVQQLAVKSGKRTIAVLGGGLDEKAFYPKQHVWLAQEIIKNNGLVMSEYPPGTPPLKHHFIARNRIISGLSVATVVIECDLQSGSLITAKYALDQNRTVYAVPGPIYAPQSQGPNNLIKMGAKLVSSANDILEDLHIKTLPDQKTNQELFDGTKEELHLLQVLGFEPLEINNIIKISKLDAKTVSSTLTFLEMKGKIRNLGGQQYVLAR
jgi:DNA processing protein